MNGNSSEATTPRIPSSSSSNPFSFPQQPQPRTPSSLLQDQELCIIGGGTGCNAVVGAFVGAKRITYCLPVSDDGGSSSEIQRVLGGPALGDIRSRLIRLIPSAPAGSPLDCIRRLLEYRLPGGVNTTNVAVKQEWGDIVEGTHRLWRGIPGDRKETIRAFLVYFQNAVLKKSQRGFNFKKASIGNLFLSGASLFLGSVPSAIFLFVSVTGISHDSVRIVPVINTSSTVTIAAELEDGHVIAGQSEISHPSSSSSTVVAPATAPLLVTSTSTSNAATLRVEAIFPLTRATTPSFPEPPVLGAEEDESHAEIPPSPDLHIATTTTSTTTTAAAAAAAATDPNASPASSPSDFAARSASQHLEFTKDASEIPPLPCRIQRIFYLSSYGLEIHPRPNSHFLQALQDATTLIYAPGSLYTSIIPCLVLRPVGDLIASESEEGGSRSRIRNKILLLNSTEDRETTGYEAVDFVRALTAACRRSSANWSTTGMGAGAVAAGVGRSREIEPREIVTHVVYVRNGHVRVDEAQLRDLGITPVPVGPTPEGMFEDQVVRDALAQILDSSSSSSS